MKSSKRDILKTLKTLIPNDAGKKFNLELKEEVIDITKYEDSNIIKEHTKTQVIITIEQVTYN